MSRVFSGIKPTGPVTLGNYVGALRHWVTDQHEFDALYCVVDLHALTEAHDPGELRALTLELFRLLMAVGLDPDVCTLFVQSHVHEHTDLTWLLNCIATFGELGRMTQFKDKSAGQESVSVGLFDYPVLMAADVLAYDTERVPVGDDQRQHLELARDIAIRFNHRCGDTLVVPEASIPPVGARVMDLQNPTAKMSKSLDSPRGTIKLLDDPAAITKHIKTAVTDSENEIRYDPPAKPGVSNLLQILGAVTDQPVEQVADKLAGSGYGALKTAVAEAVVEFVRPLQERYEELERDPAEVARILGVGADRAEAIAAPVLQRVRDAVGLLPRGG